MNVKKIAVFFLICVVFLAACTGKGATAGQAGRDKPFSVLVFITGVTAGSPSYEMLAQGAQEFAAESAAEGAAKGATPITVKIYEAGFNQAEWEEQLQSMVASGEYDLVLGSNPSLPEICANVGKMFPDQKFIITDAALPQGAHTQGMYPNISAYLYNQYEQALFLGYLAGLVTASKKIGFIAAQEYPLLSRQIVPGFLDGARRADPAIELDFRVIGNWYDANKAAELAAAMINAGVDVFTSIAGGAAQGLVRTIQERASTGRRNVYAVSFNTNEYGLAPGFIVGCGIMQQKKLVHEILGDYLAGNIRWGSTRTVGVKEGYLDFIFDDPGYRQYLPIHVQKQFVTFMDDLRIGRIEYTVPKTY